MREPRWLSPAEQRAWRTHLAVHKLLMHRLDRELHAHSLSLNDYEILVNLSESPGRRMRMSELADVTIQSRSRLSHQISRMEAKGLVTREDCRDDRRGHLRRADRRGLGDDPAGGPPYHVKGVREHFVDRLTDDQLEAIEAAYAPIVEHLKKLR
ncbi:MarR family winged helix-turn-helix transcriptional regulator [Nonomuraea salmonea]|uniref:MarR family winged helix-turn-helix transcriptional regulator n=1 Tax=Nonomuraea salmonea TaxID=46181 RepID=UPI002FE72A40